MDKQFVAWVTPKKKWFCALACGRLMGCCCCVRRPNAFRGGAGPAELDYRKKLHLPLTFLLDEETEKEGRPIAPRGYPAEFKILG